MITSRGPVVKPTLKLAAATLKNANPESAAPGRRGTIGESSAPARRGTIGGTSRPVGLGEIDGATVHGPLPPIASANEEQGTSALQSTTDAGDSASDTTLVGDVHTPESDEDDMNGVDPFKSSQTMKDQPVLSSDIAMPDSPGTIDDDQLPNLENSRNAKEAVDVHELPASDPSPPARPPPVPPRPKVETAKQADMVQELEFAAKQQDVTEVMGNVLFKIECALRPTSLDEDGEQKDLVKEYVNYPSFAYRS